MVLKSSRCHLGKIRSVSWEAEQLHDYVLLAVPVAQRVFGAGGRQARRGRSRPFSDFFADRQLLRPVSAPAVFPGMNAGRAVRAIAPTGRRICFFRSAPIPLLP
jgi:hypothetical protein